MKPISFYLAHPLQTFCKVITRTCTFLPDAPYLRLQYRAQMGKHLHLNNPQTFNEKLQWLKLHDRRPEYTVMVDKHLAKQYVAEKIGSQYIIPTLGVWDSPDDIDFAALPDRFVLKCNHNSGTGMYICKDKGKMDVEQVKADLRKGISEDFYLHGREWPYKDVPRKIIAEKYMEDNPGEDLRDYKFFCFDGKPVYCQVISNRSTNETIDFFDMDWNHQEFTGLARPHHPFSNNPIPIPIPSRFAEMKQAAEALAKESRFLRVDFYEVKGDMYFGELTFYPASGFGEFSPDKYNLLLGNLLTLPDTPQKKWVYNLHGGVKTYDPDEEIGEIGCSQLSDYKIFCFNGEPKIIQVDFDRFTNHRRNLYDTEWNLLDLAIQYPSDHSHIIPKPKVLDKMLALSRALSKGIPHVRTDFYIVGNSDIYFGELTFFHGCGYEKFTPEEWDAKLGGWIEIGK